MFSKALNRISTRVIFSAATRMTNDSYCCTQHSFHNVPVCPPNQTIKQSLSPLNTRWKANLGSIKDKIAIIQDDYQVTFEELDFRAKQLYFMLKYQYGLEKGDVIAHISSLRIDDTVIMLASSQLGLKYAPISPSYTTKINEISQMINAKLIITEPDMYQFVSDNNIDKIILSKEFDPNNWIADETFVYNDIADMANSDDIVSIAFTSGTTGTPKGCLYSHQAIYNNMKGFTKYKETKEELDNSSRLVMLGMNLPGLWQRWSSLMHGQTMVYANKYKFSDPEHWYNLCEHKYPEITDVILFGRAMSDFCHLDQRLSNSNLKYVVFGGDFVPFKTVKHLKHLLPPDAKLINGYGMTECGWISQLDPQKLDEFINNNADGNLNKHIPAGTLIDEVMQIKAVNGQIMVKKSSESRMKEYLNKPEKTAELFDDYGWIKTGDTGYIDNDGLLVLQGREKDIIILSNGRNISPVEIETVLGSHKDIAEVAVVGCPNTLKNKTLSGEVPVAFVVVNDKSAEDCKQRDRIRDELLGLCKKLLCEECMVEEIYFAKELPKTPARKMDKNALRAVLQDCSAFLVEVYPMQRIMN